MPQCSRVGGNTIFSRDYSLITFCPSTLILACSFEGLSTLHCGGYSQTGGNSPMLGPSPLSLSAAMLKLYLSSRPLTLLAHGRLWLRRFPRYKHYPRRRKPSTLRDVLIFAHRIIPSNEGRSGNAWITVTRWARAPIMVNVPGPLCFYLDSVPGSQGRIA